MGTAGFGQAALVAPLAPRASFAPASCPEESVCLPAGGTTSRAGIAVDGAGNIYLPTASAVLEWNATTGAITVAAGVEGTPGSSGKKLNNPAAVAVDASGNLYIVDAGNQRLVEVNASGPLTVLAPGNFQAVTVAPNGALYALEGNSLVRWTGSAFVAVASSFNQPLGLAVDRAGNIYVADSGDNLVVRVPAGGGSPVTVAGSVGQAGTPGGADNDGASGTNAVLNAPTGIAIDAAGNVYIADSGDLRVRKLDPAGVLTTAAGVTDPNNVVDREAFGAAGPANFSPLGNWAAAPVGFAAAPGGIALDGAGRLLIPLNNGEIVAMPTALNAGLASLGQASAPQPWFVENTSVTGARNADTVNIQQFNISGDFRFSATAVDEPGAACNTAATAANPAGLAPMSNPATGQYCEMDILFQPTAPGLRGGAISLDYVSLLNSAVRSLTLPILGTGAAAVASGTPALIHAVSTSGTVLGTPAGMAMDTAGNLYTADAADDVVLQIAPSGATTIVAGTFRTPGFAGDGGAATGAELDAPRAVVVDAAGDLYIADSGNHVVRVVNLHSFSVAVAGQTLAAGAIATFAGQPSLTTFSAAAEGTIASGTNEVGGLSDPVGLAVDGFGNLYVADAGLHAVRRVDYEGYIHTVAGSQDGAAGDSGDGGLATNALLDAPQSIALDAAGDLFIADTGNHVLREVTPDGQMHTLNASVQQPVGLAVDGGGDLYIADAGLHQVLMLNPAGTLTALAGSGTVGLGGDNGPALSASFESISGVYVNPVTGGVYVSDAAAGSIRQIGPSGIVHFSSGTTQQALTVTNTGTVALHLGALSSSNADFTPAYTGTCAQNAAVAPGASCTLGLSFGAHVAGPQTGTIAIASDAANAPLTFAASATGPGAVTLTLSAPAETYGGSSSLTATLSQTGATGTITYQITGGLSQTVAVGTGGVTALPPGALSAGSHILAASYSGDSQFAPATASLSFTVAPATLTIVPAGASMIFGQAVPALRYTLSGFVNGDSGAVVTGTPVLSTPATSSSDVGSYPISAQAGTLSAANYTFAAGASAQLQVIAATPALALDPQSPNGVSVSFGSPLGAANLVTSITAAVDGATVTPPGTFTFTATQSGHTVAVTPSSELEGGAWTLTANFVPGNKDYLPVSASTKLTVTPISPGAVVWNPPSPILYGTTEPLNATLSGPNPPGGTFTYACTSCRPTLVLSASSVLPVGSNSLVVVFTPQDTADYTTARLSGITVLVQNTTTVTFPSPAVTVTAGTALATLENATGSVAGTITYAWDGGAPPAAATGIGAHTLVATLAPTAAIDYAPSSATLAVTVKAANIVFPGTPVGTPASPLPVTLSFPGAVTVGSVQVVTQGYTGLDFTDAGNDSCSAGAQAAGSSCTVNVVFKPTAVGARLGAVIVYDTHNQVLQTVYLAGSGEAAQLGFWNGAPSAIAAPAGDAPQSVLVDPKGNLFFADATNNALVELPVSGNGYGSPVTLATGLNQPQGLALDGAGNLFLANPGVDDVVELPHAVSGFGAPVTIAASGSVRFGAVAGVSVDGQGNLFVLDSGNGSVDEMSSSGSTYAAPRVLAGGLITPNGLAIDGSGNLYVADAAAEARVYELPLSNGSYASSFVTLPLAGLIAPYSVAVDGGGNLYVGDAGNKMLVKLPWTGSSFGAPVSEPVALIHGLTAIALDAQGNIFVADARGGQVVKIDAADAPTLAFSATVLHSTSADSPKTVLAANIGNQPLTFSAVSYPADFPSNGGDNALCSVTAAVAQGARCDLSANFTPSVIGTLSEPLGLADNSLNGAPATQALGLTGTGLGLPQTITFTRGNLTYDGPLALSGTASSGLTVSYAITGGTGVGTLSGSVLTITQPGTFTITAQQAGNSEYAAAPAVAVTFTVSPAALTIQGLTAANKVYDGTPAATVSGEPLLIGIAGPDTAPPDPISLMGGAVGTFASAQVGNNVAVTVSGFTLSGAHAADYTITEPVLAANITAKALTVSGLTAENKSYDGTPTATITGTPSLVGIVGNDQVLLSGTPEGTFASAQASANPISVSVTGLSLSGAQAGDYTLTEPTLSARITPATPVLTWAPSSAATAVVYGTGVPASLLDASSRVAGTFRYSEAAGAVLPVGSYNIVATFTPTDATDYTTATATITFGVTPATLTVTASSASRIFGAANPPFTGTVTGLVNGDNLSVSYATVATITSSVGNYAIVPAVSGAALVNYTQKLNDGTLTILPAPQSIRFGPIGNQIYDGTPVTVALHVAASSGLPVALSVSGPASVSGTTLTVTGTGEVIVTAMQAGNNDYLPAANVSQSFEAQLGLAFGFYATSAHCDSLSLKGRIRMDSVDSAAGAFPAGLLASGGNIGTNGTLTLDGNGVIDGALYDPHGNITDHDCDQDDLAHPPSLVEHGRRDQLQGGIVTLPAALVFPAPAAPSTTAPVTRQRLTDRCGDLAGCTPLSRGHVALAPGAYGNLTVSGHTVVDLSAGSYALNSLHLDGGAVLHVVSGPVTLHLAGKDVKNDALDATGGWIDNGGKPANLIVLYGGRRDIELGSEHPPRRGQGCEGNQDADDTSCTPDAGLSAVIYAPFARVTLHGGLTFTGTIVGYTIHASGNVTVHYDRALAAMAAFSGGTPPPAEGADHEEHDRGGRSH